MIKSLLKLSLLLIFIGFLSISPKTRNIFGISLKYASQFLLWTVNNENKDKWIIDLKIWNLRR